MIVYLAGNIFDTTDTDCNDWRSEAIQLLGNGGASTLNPMDRDYRGKEDRHVKEIVELDKKDIDNCDALLTHYLKPSVGTSMEILYAWEKSIPVWVFTEESRLSPWLVYHSTNITKTMKRSVYEILSWYAHTGMGQ